MAFPEQVYTDIIKRILKNAAQFVSEKNVKVLGVDIEIWWQFLTRYNILHLEYCCLCKS